MSHRLEGIVNAAAPYRVIHIHDAFRAPPLFRHVIIDDFLGAGFAEQPPGNRYACWGAFTSVSGH